MLDLRATGYSIVAEPERNLLRITLDGFWDAATFSRFKVEAREAALRLPGPPGQHCVIADASGAATQSQELGEMLLAYMRGKTFRLAFVTRNTVIKLQARRLLKEAGAIIVETVAEAEHALFGAH